MLHEAITYQIVTALLILTRTVVVALAAPVLPHLGVVVPLSVEVEIPGQHVAQEAVGTLVVVPAKAKHPRAIIEMQIV